MKYCENCGAKMNDNALFCSQCGHKVQVIEQEASKEEIKVEEIKVEEINVEEPVVKEEVKVEPEIKVQEAPTQETKPAKAEENRGVKPEKAPAQETQPAKAARKAPPIYEQKVREFLPISLVIIGCSIIFWIVDKFGHPTGITRIFPYLIFMLITIFYSVLSMMRAVKTLNRKMYFKAGLSFALFGLLVPCAFIDFIFLVSA